MKKHTILFVDDDQNILNALKRALMDEEYRCLFANSAKEALDVLQKEDIHVIVADMKMPEMDGLTLLKIVKQSYPKIVRIVLSGFTQLPQVLAAINQADIFRFITKPWSIEEELKVVINQAIEYFEIQEEKEVLTKALEKRNEMYINVLKATEKKFKIIKKNFDYLQFIINHQNSFIIQLLKSDKRKDLVILIVDNINRLNSNFLSMFPIYPIKFKLKKLLDDLFKVLEDRFEGGKSIKLDYAQILKEYTFEGYYAVMLFVLIEISMALIQYDIYENTTIKLDCNENKVAIRIIILGRIDELIILNFLALSPYVSIINGSLKINAQKENYLEFYIECEFDKIEKNIN